MPQNPQQFTSPTGRPAKISMATQRAMDRWTQAGMSPPPVKPGESQYFYATRIGNSLTNRQRGRYGDDVTTDRIFDKRESAVPQPKPAQPNHNVSASKSKSSFGKATGAKSFGALLGIGSTLEALGKGRR